MTTNLQPEGWQIAFSELLPDEADILQDAKTHHIFCSREALRRLFVQTIAAEREKARDQGYREGYVMYSKNHLPAEIISERTRCIKEIEGMKTKEPKSCACGMKCMWHASKTFNQALDDVLKIIRNEK